MKIISNLLLRLFAVIGVVLSLFWWMHYQENPRANFATYSEMVAAGISPGWIPEVLPKSATNIHEGHDIDTNEVWAIFRYRPGDDRTVEEVCDKIAETKVGIKFLCPPFEKRTTTVVLRADGTGTFFGFEDDI